MGTTSLDTFKQEHAQIEALLDSCTPLADGAALIQKLKPGRELVRRHLAAKAEFYVALAELCTSKGDAAGANIARIFATNMGVQSGAVEKFFDTLDAATPEQVLQSFKTVVHVLKQRIQTEERAVFPIWSKHTDPAVARVRKANAIAH